VQQVGGHPVVTVGRLDDRTALVTGAARGTGEAVARLFVAEGARVLLTDVLDEAGEKVAAGLGAGAAYQRLDVRREEEWSAAVATAEERLGPIDILVNNAAILEVAAIEDTAPEKMRDILDVNLAGPYLGLQAVVPGMRARGRGSIVNVTSIDALEGEVGVSAYSASKWGLRGLTKCAALELGRHGIRVNNVCPGGGSEEMKAPFVKRVAEEIRAGRKIDFSGTPREPMGRSASLQEIARAILFFASDESGFCNGTDLAVDGGFTAGHIVPGAPGAD